MGKSKRNRNKQAEEAASQAAASSAKKKSGKGTSPAIILAIGGVALVVVIAVIAGGGANTVTMVDGKASRIIATVDECAFTTIEIAIPAGVSGEEAATAVFDRLSGEIGVGLVTVYEDNPRVEIDYCQSYTSEPVLRQALADIGYASAAPAPDPEPEPETAPSPMPESSRE